MKVKNITKKILNFIYKDKSIGVRPGQIIEVDDVLGKSILKTSSVIKVPDYEKVKKIFENVPEIEKELPPIIETPIEGKSYKSCSIPSAKLKIRKSKKGRNQKKLKTE